ncbi:MAG: carbohydrate kinase, partial [Clostridia bacterium]|nr:carbohydrate kinase [Clostridia bacterium]
DRSGCSFEDVGAFMPKVGGAPANVCAAYSILGGRSRFLTQLGDDPFGHKIIRTLDKAGVDTSCISLTDKANTALAFVALEENGNRKFSFYRNPSADMLYSPDNLKKEYFCDAFALHFCSVSLGDFPMKQAHRRAIELMREKGGIISFDPNLRFNLWESKEALKNAVLEFIPLCDIVKLSEEEILFVTGFSKAKDAAKWMFDKGVKLFLYTCGSGGAYALTKKADSYCPAFSVKAVDTTGAGDGFSGSFLRMLNKAGVTAETLSDISERTLEECLGFSNKFCAISVTRKGAIASYPNEDETLKAKLNI